MSGTFNRELGTTHYGKWKGSEDKKELEIDVDYVKDTTPVGDRRGTGLPRLSRRGSFIMTRDDGSVDVLHSPATYLVKSKPAVVNPPVYSDDIVAARSPDNMRYMEPPKDGNQIRAETFTWNPKDGFQPFNLDTTRQTYVTQGQSGAATSTSFIRGDAAKRLHEVKWIATPELHDPQQHNHSEAQWVANYFEKLDAPEQDLFHRITSQRDMCGFCQQGFKASLFDESKAEKSGRNFIMFGSDFAFKSQGIWGNGGSTEAPAPLMTTLISNSRGTAIRQRPLRDDDGSQSLSDAWKGAEFKVISKEEVQKAQRDMRAERRNMDAAAASSSKLPPMPGAHAPSAALATVFPEIGDQARGGFWAAPLAALPQALSGLVPTPQQLFAAIRYRVTQATAFLAPEQSEQNQATAIPQPNQAGHKRRRQS